MLYDVVISNRSSMKGGGREDVHMGLCSLFSQVTIKWAKHPPFFFSQKVAKYVTADVK